MDLLTFILISAAIIIIPGPNILVIVSTSLSHGRLRGMQTLAGTSCAIVIQLLIAGAGTAWLVSTLAQGLLWLKWLGVIYLIFLGFRSLVVALRSKSRADLPPATTSGSFQRGFWVGLTNPKTILLFSAYLPQFVDPAYAYGVQIFILSALFWLLTLILDSSYALIAIKLKPVPDNRNPALQDLASGLLYLGAGSLLALSRVSER